WLAATDVFARLCRVVLGHFLLRGTLTPWDISSCIGIVSRFTGMTSECGRNTQQMVSYRGISDRHQFGFMLTDQGTSRPLGPPMSLTPPDAIVARFRTCAAIEAAHGKPRV